MRNRKIKLLAINDKPKIRIILSLFQTKIHIKAKSNSLEYFILSLAYEVH